MQAVIGILNSTPKTYPKAVVKIFWVFMYIVVMTFVMSEIVTKGAWS